MTTYNVKVRVRVIRLGTINHNLPVKPSQNWSEKLVLYLSLANSTKIGVIVVVYYVISTFVPVVKQGVSLKQVSQWFVSGFRVPYCMIGDLGMTL